MLDIESWLAQWSRAELPEKYRQALASGPEELFEWASDVIKTYSKSKRR